MRNNLFSIGETAKMKNISVKSLRYYERIGILKPAYTDPSTGYRYYSPGQLVDLDVIISCVDLGIPLKSIFEYTTQDNTLDFERLLESGREIALQRIREAQNSLKRIDSYQAELALQNKLRTKPEPYTRTIPAWKVAAMPFAGRGRSTSEYINAMSMLYAQAEKRQACPLYFQGLIIDSENMAGEANRPTTSTYVRIAEEPTVPFEPPLQMLTLPKRRYLGRRITAAGLEECVCACLDYAAMHPGNYLAIEVWDAQLPENEYVLELLQAQ